MKIDKEIRDELEILPLLEDLCSYATGVVSEENEALFKRISMELPLTLHRYKSGQTYNGWVVPHLWQVNRATISQNGRILFDGKSHTLGVASYSKSFSGSIDLDELERHVVTAPKNPEAFIFHCMWQYRPWDVDWAFSIPYEIFQTFGPGKYDIDLQTRYIPGEMVVGEYNHRGASDQTIVFNSHTCHPHQANDGFAGVAILIRLFQWLKGQKTHYSYKLILGPEHLGTVFFLRDKTEQELSNMVSGVFAEMPGTAYPIKAASSFLGGQMIDKAIANSLAHHSKAYELVPWRKGAGNDETVWEAPGYEVPFVELTRCRDLFDPYPQYHSSLDSPASMDPVAMDEFYKVLLRAVYVLENNARLYRKFNGLICLSNPEYDLYMERPDPAVQKNLASDSEKWGVLLDSLLRYFDGSMDILDIAQKHNLPFDRVHRYLLKFAEKGLIDIEFEAIPKRRLCGVR